MSPPLSTKRARDKNELQFPQTNSLCLLMQPGSPAITSRDARLRTGSINASNTLSYNTVSVRTLHLSRRNTTNIPFPKVPKTSSFPQELRVESSLSPISLFSKLKRRTENLDDLASLLNDNRISFQNAEHEIFRNQEMIPALTSKGIVFGIISPQASGRDQRNDHAQCRAYQQVNPNFSWHSSNKPQEESYLISQIFLFLALDVDTNLTSLV